MNRPFLTLLNDFYIKREIEDEKEHTFPLYRELMPQSNG